MSMQPFTVLATGPSATAAEFEPLPTDRALRRVDPERMILTPHILALARGEVPAYVVNPDAVARWRARRG